MKSKCNPREAKARIVREALIVIPAANLIICGNESERVVWWLFIRPIKWWRIGMRMKMFLGLRNSHVIKEMRHPQMKKLVIFLTN